MPENRLLSRTTVCSLLSCSVFISASLEYKFLDEFELDLVVRLWFLVIVVIIATTVLGVLVGSFDEAVCMVCSF